MTCNRTIELLREGLTERGIEWRSGLEGVTFVGDWCFVEYDNGKLAATCEPALTPEQAIAATLGSERHPYEQRITGDGSDWGEIMIDAFDSLMAAACESCTPEQMARFADHIRAELGSGTCKCVSEYAKSPIDGKTIVLHRCSSCHELMRPHMRFCPNCGARVMSE